MKKNLVVSLMKLVHLVGVIALFGITWTVFLRFYNIEVAARYNYFVVLMYSCLIYFFIRTYNAYMIEYQRIRSVVFSHILSIFLSTILVFGSVMIVWNKWRSPVFFLINILVSSLFSCIWAWTANRLYFALNKPLKTLVVYKDNKDLRRLNSIDSFYKRFNVVNRTQLPASAAQLLMLIEDYEAVFISGADPNMRNAAVKFCLDNNIECFFAPHIGDIILANATHVQSFGTPVMNIGYRSVRPEYFIIKRASDILISAAALIILSPLMLITALAVRIGDGGPAIYRQTRLTRDGRSFTLYKFRSMRTDAEQDGVARLADAEDERITRVGRIIRACRIDELPQLFNIIRGDMSLVGPRPERPEIAAGYEELLPSFNLRLRVRAGLTGYAQVFGRYSTDPYDKLEFDLLYINRMSVLTDIQLIFATIRILFIKESAEGIDRNRDNYSDEEEI